MVVDLVVVIPVAVLAAGAGYLLASRLSVQRLSRLRASLEAVEADAEQLQAFKDGLLATEDHLTGSKTANIEYLRTLIKELKQRRTEIETLIEHSETLKASIKSDIESTKLFDRKQRLEKLMQKSASGQSDLSDTVQQYADDLAAAEDLMARFELGFFDRPMEESGVSKIMNVAEALKLDDVKRTMEDIRVRTRNRDFEKNLALNDRMSQSEADRLLEMDIRRQASRTVFDPKDE